MISAGKIVAITTVSLALLAGCGKKEAPPPAPPKPVPASPHAQGPKKPTTVVVPPFVQGKWKSVRIGFTEKASGKEGVYVVPIGGEVSIPDSNISVRVDTFLPHFTMDGTTLTSQSNEPKNPAALVVVLERGEQIFKGWLFALYPTTHAFQHPKYGFKLVGMVPAP